MNGVDIALGFLAGVVSCLTPGALLLFPLFVAAAGAASRAGMAAIAIGLGLAVVLTGTVASSIGLDAARQREIVCGLLLLQGIILISASTVERFPALTGGHETGFAASAPLNSTIRLTVLALFVGAIWKLPPGPTLGKASLMAAGAGNSAVAFGVLFAFGVGAAVPWIILGRVVRLVLRPIAARGMDGMAGQRILGATLLIVAVLGITGFDATIAQALGPLLPAWTKKMAVQF